ncbi:MAG TPA: MarR family winged helix-turn-helix transcriptional regulator [Dehalococcoidia bacterium]|nr:MarR family winged helix-turn-helix transcriptional regulator [Dehalococcoidia bacterium]
MAPTDPIASVRSAWQALSRQWLLPDIQGRLAEASGFSIPRTARLALAQLAEHGDMRISELASLAGVDVSTMSRSLQTLESAGLICRHPGDDLRVVVVSVTPAGEQAVARTVEAAEQLLSDVLAAWPAHDREQLAQLLDRFAHDFADYLAANSGRARARVPLA